jgi:hypothetical protein
MMMIMLYSFLLVLNASTDRITNQSIRVAWFLATVWLQQRAESFLHYNWRSPSPSAGCGLGRTARLCKSLCTANDLDLKPWMRRQRWKSGFSLLSFEVRSHKIGCNPSYSTEVCRPWSTKDGNLVFLISGLIYDKIRSSF